MIHSARIFERGSHKYPTSAREIEATMELFPCAGARQCLVESVLKSCYKIDKKCMTAGVIPGRKATWRTIPGAPEFMSAAAQLPHLLD